MPPSLVAGDSGWPELPWDFVLRQDPCAYCGILNRTAPRQHPVMTVDHIDPRPRDPDRSWLNRTGACRDCNALKADVPVLLFLVETQAERDVRVSARLRCGGTINRRFFDDSAIQLLQRVLSQ